MAYIDNISSAGHEQVSIFTNNSLAITAIIAVHNTVIGPGLGGCRLRPYQTIDQAALDVLKLSQAMTWKNSLCGIKFGGGKSVIITERTISKQRKELFEWFGDCVESLGGSYIAAEDMGSTVEDMEVIASRTKYVAGRDPKLGGAGDPSPYTALGVFSGIRACLEHLTGSDSCQDKRVAIQGVGAVGRHLALLLSEAGAKLTISDTREDILRKVQEEFSAEVLGPEEILTADCDVLAPCAIGGVITEEVVDLLNCKIIAGGANNQLVDGVEQKLVERGIVYAPDFAINSGGVVLCADEFEQGGFNAARVNSRAANVYSIIKNILASSKESTKLAGKVAIELAEARIERSRASGSQ